LIKKRSISRIYFGWWMVIFPGILSGLGVNYYSQGMSVFFKDIAAELQLSRASTSLAASIGNFEGGLLAPLTGWLADKYGPRWVVITGLCFVIAGLALMNFISSPWHFYVVWGLMIGLGLNFGLTIAQDKVLANWFIGKRGLAIGSRFAIIGICGVLVVPLVTWLVGEYGWRTTCLLWSGIMTAGLFIAWFFIKQQRPEYYGLLPDGITSETMTVTDRAAMFDRGMEYAASFDEREYTLKQAFRTPAYWIILVAWACTMLVYGGFTIHSIPFLTDTGISRTEAGVMVAMMVFFTIPSRFIGGLLTDRVRKNRLKFVAAGAFFIQAIGITSYILYQNVTMAYVFLIFYGLGNGAVTPIRLSMGARFFGRKAFTSILGIMMLFITPVTMISPIYTGWIHDTTGSYINAFIVFASLLVFAGVLLCFLRPPTLPDSNDIPRIQ